MDEKSLHIEPFHYQGTLSAIGSKSYFQRAMAIALLAQDNSLLQGLYWSADAKAVCEVIQALGARVKITDEMLILPSRKKLQDNIQIHVGESGLALRMFVTIAGLFIRDITIMGKGSLLNRPIQPIQHTLDKIGLVLSDTKGTFPLHLSGKLTAGIIHIDGSFSSQVLSGLLISLPLLQQDSTLFVHNLTSRPYIDMTLEIMKHFGVIVTHDAYQKFIIKGNQHYDGRVYSIEGDWSSAANHLVGAAISGTISLTGLNINSLQADRTILTVLEHCGAMISVNEDKVTVTKNEARPFSVDITQCPDLFPPLVVLAASCHGDSKIKGTNRLLHKESDRLKTICESFGDLGLNYTLHDDEIEIHGKGVLYAGTIDSHNDHRIAMAGAIAATIAEGPIRIKRARAVEKSYPNFFEDLEKVGARIN